MESRRKFLTQLGTVIGLMSGAGWWHRLSAQSVRMHPLSIPELDAGGERVRVATVGMGIMGFQDTHSVVKVPGVELVGVADLYDGRLRRAKEVFGDRIITTRDYRELIARNDVDAVMIATADLWHNTVAIDALKAGKAVYCEKPMVQHLDQGAGVISAQQQTGHPLQVGSQRVSSVLYAQAKNYMKPVKSVSSTSCAPILIGTTRWEPGSILSRPMLLHRPSISILFERYS